MDINFEQFSPEQIRHLASSPAAQALMAMLQQSPQADMQSALAGAKAGDITQVQQALSAVLADPKARALLRQLQEDSHG